MLRVFQDIFADPMDHSLLTFEGELKDECWNNGQLLSSDGNKWSVDDGIPDFVLDKSIGASWTEERIKKLLSDGVYRRNWNNGKAVLSDTNSLFAKVCQEIMNIGEPVIDIASGPGGGFMPSLLSLNPDITIMATDVGINVMRGWKEFFDTSKLSFPICFTALNAMKMPFSSGSVKVITSNAGFSSTGNLLMAFQEASRVLSHDGIIYAGEVKIEPEGLKVLSSEMGWDFEEKFGNRYKMSFYEIFHECNLSVIKEQPYFKRKMRPDDNEFAAEACKLGIDLWLKGNFFWLGHKCS